MAAISETRARVIETFQSLKDKVGYISPREAARILVQNPEIEPVIEREIFRHPTKDFLIDGAEKVLSELIHAGDTVRIWSDEYISRIGSSRLGKLKRELPREERHRLSLAMGINKHNVLADLFAQRFFGNIQNIAVVDNRLENLVMAQKIIDKQAPDVNCSLFWISDEFSIKELLKYRQNPTLWLIDFNHTLLNTDKYEQSVVDSVSNILTPIV